MPNLLGRIQWLMRLLGRGMNADLRPDKMEDGLHRDAMNFRMGSILGNSGDLESVGTQEVLYPPQPDEEITADSYVCLGMIQAGADVVSFHASFNDSPRIKVNGVTMAYSPGIPYTADHPLQLRVLDRKQGPIVFPVDGQSPALFWDIEAIKAAYAAGDQTYLTEFDVRSVSVVPAGPTEWPQHTGNPNIGTGAKPGQYIFYLRYYDRSGNRSNFGPPTPHITVAAVQAPIYIPESPLDSQYPGGQTAGGPPAAAEVTTPYGIALRWQIDNRFDNSGIEVVVTKFINGEGLQGPGETEVVARIPMINNQFDASFEFVYPRDNNFSEIIPIDEAQQQFVNFTAPKAVEVIDNRVVYANIRLKDEVVQLNFQSSGGETTFPFTDRVFTRYSNTDYNDGFADPVNNTYMKSALHGERYSVGLMLWDGTASRSAVVNVRENVLFPERARRKAGDSLTYSSDPIYRTNTECQGDDPVSPTFDAIVQGTRRKYNDSLTNVVPGFTVEYNPFRPSSPVDPNFIRYREKPIEQWRINATNYLDDAGFVFDTQIHSLGLGIYGPDNLDQQAPWCEVFSVMRTAPANRVVASGMAVYYQPAASTEPNRKSANILRAYFPDIDSAVVPLAIQQDIQNNPQNYKVKFTPYGFFNEIYSYRRRPFPFIGTDCVDMLTYMDMQNDTGTGTATSVNVGEPPGLMAVQPGASAPFSRTNNVGYPAWRRLTSDTAPASSTNPLFFMNTDNTDQGAVELGLTNFAPVTVGRGSYHIIKTDKAVYSAPTDLTAGPDFSDAATRRYNGPVWIVDILRSGNVVPTLNVQQYLHTGTHIATSRTIGIFQEGTTEIELFHARPYDAIPRVGGVDIRYAYVLVQGGVERRWMHIDSNTGGASIADIVTDINANGFWVDPDGQQVFGLYSSHEDINSRPHPIWFLDFPAIPDMAPPATGARIVVKYDKREPILTHGFDCTINPTVWAPLDMTNDAPYPTTAPMPYAAGIRAANYLLPRHPTTGDAFEDNEFTDIKTVRQWVMMGSVVARTPQRMNLEAEAAVGVTRFSFPRTHYVIRPTIPVSFDTGVANGLFLEYDTTYPNEAQYFMYGGTWFDSTYNLDYAKQPLVSGVGVPLNGQNPVTLLPTGHIASLRYNPLSLDSPGFRTFTFENLFVADEATGEVKFIAALDQGGRQAFWGWTQNGYYNIPFNAQMLVDADGNAVATQSVGTFWPRRENWIARGDHGMPDDFWRMAVRANVPMGSQNVDTVVWSDRFSVYMLSGGVAVDIASNKIRSILSPILSTTTGGGAPGYSAVYNKANQEVWMSVLGGRTFDSQRMFVYDMVRKEWVGEFSFRHEQYLNTATGVLAATHLTIYEVDKQNVVGSDPVQCYFTVPFFPQYQLRKEAMRWRVVGDMPPNFLTDPNYTAFRPSAVEVYDAEFNLLSRMDGTQYALFAKNYDGFEGWVNRVLGTINTNRPLPQSQGFFLRVRYDTFGQKVVASVGMQLKTIK